MRFVSPILRFVGRTLGRHPGFSLVVVSILAVAIAGNATMFSLVEGALLEPLPFAEADRLVTVDVLSTKGYYISTSIPNYRDWRDRSRAFDRWGASAGWNMTLTGEGDAEVLEGEAVLGDFFGVLGLRPAVGRVFSGAEAEPGADAVAVLGHDLWRDRFHSDPEILGRTLQLDGRPYVVVGVLAPGVGYPAPETPFYFPMGSLDGLPWNERTSSFGTRAVARLAPGVDLARARADLERVHREIEEVEGGPVDAPELRTLEDYFLGSSRLRLWLLFGAVASVLAIAVANVTNLFLVRNEARAADLALRRALGAGRWRLAAPALGEGVVLSLAGGAAGLALAALLGRSVLPLLARGLPDWIARRAELDWRAALFTLALTLVAGLIAGLVPALAAERTALAGRLRDGSRAVGGHSRLRSGLVVVQIAIAVVLLVGATLLVDSLRRLGRVDLGFDPDRVLTARTQVPDEYAGDAESWRDFYGRVEERVAAIPGVRSAAISLLVPLAQRSWEMRIHPEGEDPTDEDTARSVLFGIVSESYFETLGVPIVRGRGFEPTDRDGSLPVAVIDETMAELFWPGENPLGRRVTVDESGEDGEAVYRTIVGVAANVHHYSVGEPSRIQVYLPLRQTGQRYGIDMTVLARTEVPPLSLTRPLRDAVSGVAANAPVYSVTSMEALVDRATAPNRVVGVLVTAFAALALLLAALGVFGLLSWLVVQRLREIGIRMALGADGARVVAWVSSRSLRLTALGLLVGLGAAVGVVRLLEGFLYRVEPFDPVSYLSAVAVIVLTAVAATALPAWRAARADPSRVLRA
ncbi:MAG: ABC transporter permease [Thermoanaerobaculia bacterium]